MATLLNPHLPFQVTDSNGNVVSGAKIYVYDAGTTTDADVYQDSALSSAHPQPVVADSSGFIPQIFIPTGQEYKYILRTSADVEILTRDNIDPSITNGGGTLPITGGGTGSSTASAARTALGAAAQTDYTALNTTVSTATTAQSTATWEAGTSTAETVVSPAKIQAQIVENIRTGKPSARIYDSKASGTNGGTFTASAWQKRDLNATIDPDSFVTLASDEFSFTKAGYVEWSAPGATCGVHKTRLYNVTDSVSVSPPGTSELAINSTSSQTRSFGGANVEASKTYRIEHRCSVTKATNGFGEPTVTGEVEVYTEVKYWADL